MAKKFQIFTYFGSQVALAWKTYKKSKKDYFNQSSSVSVTQKPGKHTYIDSVCVAKSLAEILYVYPWTPCIHIWVRMILDQNSYMSKIGAGTQRCKKWRKPLVFEPIDKNQNFDIFNSGVILFILYKINDR